MAALGDIVSSINVCHFFVKRNINIHVRGFVAEEQGDWMREVVLSHKGMSVCVSVCVNIYYQSEV